MTFRALMTLGGLTVLGALGEPRRAGAQVAEGALDTTVTVPDSGDVLGEARAAQARFERRRLRHLPVTLGSLGGACDERVGRFCTWYDEGEWYPIPERDEVRDLRAELLAGLDSLQGLLPGERWILGQRVWYRAETGDWDGALAVARTCGDVEPWWCAALEGFALHGNERHRAAEEAFERALSGMDSAMAAEWRVPRRAVDSESRDLLDRLGRTAPDSIGLVLERLWLLADPLFLVEGNDRRTAHYARWTVSTLREGSHNPFHIRWGTDLEELTIRHGWEIGWERAPSPGFTSVDHVVGHKHPEGRDFMPPGRALIDPGSATDDDLRADRGDPRSLYAPEYAPVLLPMQGQLAVFPRGERMMVVATYFLPEDTTFHSDHTHDLAWMEPGSQAGMPDRAGLFLVPADGGRMLERTAEGRAEGVLAVEAPAGAYVVSSEMWSPSLRRAGRLRAGIRRDPVPVDIAALSDLLMVERVEAEREPKSLEEVLALTLPTTDIRPDQELAIAWEVAGLGFRPETLRFELSVERTDRGVIRRLGEFLGLADTPQPLALSWEEPAPDRPSHHFRYLDLDVPPLDPGDYRIRLSLKTDGRSDVVAARSFTVFEPEER
jgi:hypothetical protein